MTVTVDEIKKEDTVAVIDGNSLLHRAFHAVPLTMTAPDGRPTNACFGFISMLLKLAEEFEPNGIVCAFDSGRPQFRMDILEQYKAKRPPTDPLLKQQFSMIEELLDAMAIPVVKQTGWEGDDILGTLAARGEALGMRMLLVTGDKDALQLATNQTSIVSTKKGISDVIIYDPAAVMDRYGVMPEQVPDFLGLKGDPSDNIPGVAGVGEKTASKLIHQYGSLEEVFAHADGITGKMGENIRAGEKDAYDSRFVATISREVPLEIDLREVSFPSFDIAVVRDAFEKLRLNAPMAKVLTLNKRAKGRNDNQASSSFVSAPTKELPFLGEAGTGATCVIAPLFEGDSAQAFLQKVVEDHERVGVYIYRGEGLSLFGVDQTLYVAGKSGVAIFSKEEMTAALAMLIKEGIIIALDTKEIIQAVLPEDTSCEAFIGIEDIDPTRICDLSIAAYLLNSSRNSYELATLVSDYLATSLPQADALPKTIQHSFAASKGTPDAIIAAACLCALDAPVFEALDNDASRPCYDEIEMPLVPVLAQMERIGMDLDIDTLAALQIETTSMLTEYRAEIFRLAGEEFNIDSPKQLGTILFEKLKLPVIKKTKTGYSTNAQVLAELKPLHPLPAKIVEYREVAKIKSTYIDALPLMVGGDSRLHTSFNQTVTATGRLSSSNPNLQNIPVRTEFGRQIREAFRPKEADWVFLSADYSQIELRLLAHLSADKGLIGAFKSGNDFHAQTASRVFGVPLAEVDTRMRSRAKAVNFGIVYGQQAFGLSKSLGISFQEAQQMINRYFDAYPDVNAYLEAVVEHARETGVATTLFGRKRHIEEIHSHNANLRAFGERTAMNHPMQGTAADIIKLAMIKVQYSLMTSKLQARFCLQVHDELDFECPKEEVDALTKIVKDCMEQVVDLRVPLDASVSVGASWAETK